MCSRDLQIEDDRPPITPVQITYSLDALVAGITDENRHDEVEWGVSVGAEVLLGL